MIGILAGAGVLVMIVLASPLFAISRVHVTGAVYTDAADIASAVKPVRGKPILTATELAVADRWRADGAIILHVVADGQVAGALKLAVPLKVDVAAGANWLDVDDV